MLLYITGGVGFLLALIAIVLVTIFCIKSKSPIIPIILFVFGFLLFMGSGFMHWNGTRTPEADKAPKEDIKSSDTNSEDNSTRQTDEDAQYGPSVEILSEDLRIYKSLLDKGKALYLCELKNTGSVPVKVKNISIDVKGENDELITSSNYASIYPDVIDVGGIGYICEEVFSEESNSDISVNSIKTATLHYSIEEKDFTPLPVDVSQISLRSPSNWPEVIGLIKNAGEELLSTVYVVAPIYSPDGNFDTIAFTILEDLVPGDEKGFEQSAVHFDTSIDYSSHTVGDVLAYVPTIG